MAHIVPIDRNTFRRFSDAESTPRDPFDVVVFLNHFMESDRYPDAIISQMATPQDAAPEPAIRNKPTAHHHLSMQLGPKQLAFSLGRG